MKSSSGHSRDAKRPSAFVRTRTHRGSWGAGCNRGSSMRQSFAFRRSLRFIALALCSVSIFVFVSPASARPHHGAGRHARAYHAGHHAKHHYAYRHHRHAGRMSRLERGVQQMQAGGFADTNPSFMESSPADGCARQLRFAQRRRRGARRSWRPSWRAASAG